MLIFGLFIFPVGTFKTKGKDLVYSVLDAALKAGYRSIGKFQKKKNDFKKSMEDFPPFIKRK